jgi:Neuraminidase (sialidase)
MVAAVAPPPISPRPAPRPISKVEVFRSPVVDPYDLKNVYGFNHAPSVTKLSDGRFLAAWFSGPFEASVHQLILSATSDDGGTTWSPTKVLQDTPHTSDFDPAFVSTPKRTYLFYTAGRWNRYPFVGPGKKEQELVGVKSFKLMERHTDDSGATWSEPTQVLEHTGIGCRSNGIQLATGELLLPLYSFDAPYVSSVIKSTDGGKTWKQFGHVAPPGKIGAAEPTICELRERGRVLMALRTNDGYLWTARSSDAGETWSEPVKSDMVAATASHNLFRLSDGRIALTHGDCSPPQRSRLTVRISNDDGTTWDEPLLLASLQPVKEGDATWGRELTYPSVAQRNDEDLLVIWTWIEMSPDSQWGAIEAARVRAGP